MRDHRDQNQATGEEKGRIQGTDRLNDRTGDDWMCLEQNGVIHHVECHRESGRWGHTGVPRIQGQVSH